MRKLLVICGPTATGKTGLGVKLAKDLNGEIISADSRQVYQGMDIGTGKDIPTRAKFEPQNSRLKIKNQNYQVGFYSLEGVSVWLLDVVPPDYRFSVADYLRCVRVVVEDIWQRGKLPIVVGGTGFYIKALIEGVGTVGVEPDWELRDKLGELKISELGKKLRELDQKKWQSLNESDRKNPRRLIRAIEIALRSKKSEERSRGLSIGELLMIGLKADYDFLYQRIDGRVEKRVEQGLEKEIKRLLKKGYHWKNSVLSETLAYREWQSLFENKVEGRRLKEEIIKKWKFDEHAYARRQMTWFKKQPGIKWFNISQKNYQDKVAGLAQTWYDKN